MRTWIVAVVMVLASRAQADERTGVFVDQERVLLRGHLLVLDRKLEHRGPIESGWSHPLCAIRMSEIRFGSTIGAAAAPTRRPFIDTSSTALVTVFDGH